METIKPRERFFETDPRMSGFVLVDTVTSQMRDATLDDHYGDVCGFRLNPDVPETVVSYINVIETLYLYGWLYYPFFTVCQPMTGMAVEMALRLRLPETSGKQDRRTLYPLLRTAIDSGLIRDEGFPSLSERQDEAKQMYEEFDKASGSNTVVQPTPYVEVLATFLPKLRNHFAHPHAAWIVTPGMALDSIRLAVEIANQLWP